jgi:hypothetical protein
MIVATRTAWDYESRITHLESHIRVSHLESHIRVSHLAYVLNSIPRRSAPAGVQYSK